MSARERKGEAGPTGDDTTTRHDNLSGVGLFLRIDDLCVVRESQVNRLGKLVGVALGPLGLAACASGMDMRTVTKFAQILL